jgi:hypothetical protein
MAISPWWSRRWRCFSWARDPACAVPYAAPGNITLLYEGARAVCTELPTGRYSVNVVHGLAGAAPVPTSTAASATGVTLAGGQPSGQFWIIPNELGPPDTRYDPAARDQLNPPGSTETLTLDEQGDGGRFLVTDLEPSDDLPSARPTCQQALDPLAGTVRPDPVRAGGGDVLRRRAAPVWLAAVPGPGPRRGARVGAGAGQAGRGRQGDLRALRAPPGVLPLTALALSRRGWPSASSSPGWPARWAAAGPRDGGAGGGPGAPPTALPPRRAGLLAASP